MSLSFFVCNTGIGVFSFMYSVVAVIYSIGKTFVTWASLSLIFFSMRYNKIVLRLVFLFSCMMPRRSADGLSYIPFILIWPTLGLSTFIGYKLTGEYHFLGNWAITGICYAILAFTFIFKFPYITCQRHINRLVFKCRYRFLYTILALLISAICIVLMPTLIILTK